MSVEIANPHHLLEQPDLPLLILDLSIFYRHYAFPSYAMATFLGSCLSEGPDLLYL